LRELEVLRNVQAAVVHARHFAIVYELCEVMKIVSVGMVQVEQEQIELGVFRA